MDFYYSTFAVALSLIALALFLAFLPEMSRFVRHRRRRGQRRLSGTGSSIGR